MSRAWCATPERTLRRPREHPAALEAHTVNLAAELRGTGVTVNAYRPGKVGIGAIWDAGSYKAVTPSRDG